MLVVGGGGNRVRLAPQIVGGGQQLGRRGGTVNAAGVIGFAAAAAAGADLATVQRLRNRLSEMLSAEIDGLVINGPPMHENGDRLPGNLNVRTPDVEGAALLTACPGVAFSTGSACSSTADRPSHVLRAIGLTDDEARRSIRFGIGPSNTEAEIERAVELVAAAYARVRG